MRACSQEPPGGILANLCEREALQDLAIFEHGLQQVIGLFAFDGDELSVTLDERETAGLAAFAAVRDRVFEHADPFAVDRSFAALERKLLSVTVDLLQQRTAHAEGNVRR